MKGPPDRTTDLIWQAYRIALETVGDAFVAALEGKPVDLPTLRTDAADVDRLRDVLRGKIPVVATSYMDRAIGMVSRSVDEQAQRVTGIDPSRLVGDHAIRAIRDRGTRLITDATSQQVDKLSKILEANPNLHVRDLVSLIQAETGKSVAKAKLWARDQSLKMNAAITRERHESLGITEYIWTTSNDERVRETHAQLADRTFRYDNPPIVDGKPVNPGEDYQCRCIAYPVSASTEMLRDAPTPDVETDVVVNRGESVEQVASVASWDWVPPSTLSLPVPPPLPVPVATPKVTAAVVVPKAKPAPPGPVVTLGKPARPKRPPKVVPKPVAAPKPAAPPKPVAAPKPAAPPKPVAAPKPAAPPKRAAKTSAQTIRRKPAASELAAISDARKPQELQQAVNRLIQNQTGFGERPRGVQGITRVENLGVRGMASWDGLVQLDREVYDAMRSGIRKLEMGVKVSGTELQAIRTTAHETIHAYGPVRSETYGGWHLVNGVVELRPTAILEEIATELVAREVAASITGTAVTEIGAYAPEVGQTLLALAEALGESIESLKGSRFPDGSVDIDFPREMYSRLVEGARRFKQDTTPLTSADEIYSRFAKHLNLTPSQASRFEKQMQDKRLVTYAIR